MVSRLCVLVSVMTSFLSSSVNGGHVFCYYSSFAQTRQGVGKFLPEKIDPFLCSHVIYAFVDITADGTDLKPFNRNDQGANGLYSRTLALKQQNPDLKVLLAVGGWQIGSKPFIPMVSDEGKRRVWVKNVVKYLRRHSFDGFDVDWEFPATRGSPPEDKYRFTSLMKELYEGFAEDAQETGKDKLLLTMATASGTYYIDQSYEPYKIIKYIDFMLLMTYNYHGQWEKTTGHHSGLYGHRDDPVSGEKSQLNQQWSIDYWLDVGISPSKLIVGIPTYGMSFTLADASQHGVQAPAAGGGRMGDYTKESGILSFYEICMNQREKGWEREWIDDQAVPYTFHWKQWAGYDDAKSVVLKAENIVRRGLAGAFVWSVEMDDFNGVCDQGKYPLLSAINDVINGQGAKTRSASRKIDMSETKLQHKPEEYEHSTVHQQNIDDQHHQQNKNNNNNDNNDDDDDDDDNKNSPLKIKRKLNSRRRGHKIKGRKPRVSIINTASGSNPNLEGQGQEQQAKAENSILKSTSRSHDRVPPMISPASSSSPSPLSAAVTTMTSFATEADDTTPTKESLKIKWWSGTVYREEDSNNKLYKNNNNNNNQASKSKMRRQRGRVSHQAQRKMRKMSKGHNKTEQDWKENRVASKASSHKQTHVPTTMTQRPATRPWWRHDTDAPEKVTAEKVTPKWRRWSTRRDSQVTERPKKELPTSSSSSSSSSSLSPPSSSSSSWSSPSSSSSSSSWPSSSSSSSSLQTHSKSLRAVSSRRSKLLTYRRPNSVASSIKHGGLFSKKLNKEKTTKKVTVKTAAASARATDCQSLGAGTFPDPESCHRFIICMPGSWLEHPPHVMYCPYGTMFDENLNICNYSSRVRCPYWKSDNNDRSSRS